MPNAKYNSFKRDISHVTNQVTGTGYTAGGKALTGQAVTLDLTNDVSVFTAANVTWAASTITASGAVLYKQTTGELIAYFDFVTDKVSTNGDFTVQWNASGILNIS